MTEGSNRRMPEPDELEPRLGAVRSRIVFPPTPDIWPAIAHDLVPAQGSSSPRLTRPNRVKRRFPIRLLAAAAMIIVLIGATLIAVPELRAVVADRLGLPGIVIRLLDERRAVLPAPEPEEVAWQLGRQLPLADAQAEAGFTVQVPTAIVPGPPDRVYVAAGSTNGSIVTLVYRASEVLPESDFTGVGALLTQFQAATNRELIEKGVFAKGVGPETSVTAVAVIGAPGYWIEGEAHLLVYKIPTGENIVDEPRLAGNVLIWASGDVTFRLESELTMEMALAIAESMRPVGAADVTGTD